MIAEHLSVNLGLMWWPCDRPRFARCWNTASLGSLSADEKDTANPDLKILVRTNKQGDNLYLCVCNTNLEAPVTADVTVRGTYTRALDITVPGWFPVPIAAGHGGAVLKVRLEPGEWTMLQLSK